MGVDFALDYGCPVKDQLSMEGLVRLVKTRDRAATILAMVRRDGNTKPPSEILITQRVQRPNGVQEDQAVSIQSMIDQAAALEGLAHHCQDCSANLAMKPFTCYGSIRYPIRLRTEQWLLSLLPEDINCTAGIILQKYIKDFRYDGGDILKLRQNPTFFEDRTGPTRTWKSKGFLGRLSTAFSLTSSQLLQMLFCVGALQPPHCTMLCLFLGLIPHDTPADQLQNQNTFLRVAFSDGDMPSDVPDIGAFIHFSDALLRAVALNTPVAIDY
ncbi:MAG TPA: hypothetical protein VFE47_15220 [Tepidisphaeraceae bacterium]|jgi:hypothetical protein|nr:hypothetical protein [Tepidisphaeraceae bacterium]